MALTLEHLKGQNDSYSPFVFFAGVLFKAVVLDCSVAVNSDTGKCPEKKSEK